jgi:DNA-binding PadR family transcriptional regulator
MVSSDTTRMLVLGVAQLFEPANGYQLRRELLSWNVESWASVNPGSIYSMLSTLTKQGMLTRHDLDNSEATRPIAVYTVTDAGHAELLRLVREGIVGVAPFDQTALYAGLSLFVTLFSRAEALAMLRERGALLDERVELAAGQVAALETSDGTPPHVAPLVELGRAIYVAERAWLASFVQRASAGEFLFKGEPAMEKWRPAANDPAWAMVKERASYLAQLKGS